MQTDNSNRRQNPRSSYRTVVTIVQPDVRDASGSVLAVKGWSDDISATGVRLLCEQPLNHPRVWLRFLLPGGVVYCLEGTILRHHTEPHGAIRSRRSLVHHAVRFEHLVTEDEFNRILIEQVPQPVENSTPDEGDMEKSEETNPRRSLWNRITTRSSR
ncbi:MAG: PilZ domain-containing protein [Planctomycetaceae bacterium]